MKTIYYWLAHSYFPFRLFVFSMTFLLTQNLLSQNYAVRFFGTGTGDIDRIKIPIDNPHRKLDVGYDFTIEFQMRALAADNTMGGSVNSGTTDDWTLGHVIVDRDIFGPGDYGDYGISLVGGRIAFGVNNGSASYTLVGSTNVANDNWRHIAVTRNSITGAMQIFVDGNSDAYIASTSVTGNVSYRDGRTINNGWVNEPFIVLGAEKHDYNNTQYPSYNGHFDEFRISDVIRYTSSYTPVDIFSDDNNTMALYHFDEGTGTTITDEALTSTGNTTNGTMSVGGSPQGPVWVFRGHTWTGSNNANWNNAANWEPQSVPTAADDVLIANATNQPVVNMTAASPAQCKSLFVQAGATLTIPENGALTVNDQLINSGTINIGSNTTGSGSLIHDNTGVTATIERYVEGWTNYPPNVQPSRGWHYLSSPVVDQAISDFHTANSGNDFYKWDEPVGEWVNRTLSNGNLNPDFETDFLPGRGYLIAYANNQTFNFLGEMSVNDIAVNGLTNTLSSYAKGWHLLGNPFASALQWNNTGGDWNLTNVAANCQIWNENSASFAAILPNGIIPAHNGFMVYTTGNGSLTIPSSARTHNAANWYKNSYDENSTIVLKAIDPEGATAQETIIRFHENATNSFDLEHDLFFMAGFAPRFYSITNNEKYLLNTLPNEAVEESVSLGFVKNQFQNFSIEIAQNTPQQPLFILDLKTNTQHQISTSPYYFTAGENDNPNRFLLKIGNVDVNELNTNSHLRAWFYGNNIFYFSETGNMLIEVFDLKGRKVHSGSNAGSGLQVFHLQQPAGIYVVRLQNSDGLTGILKARIGN